MASTPDQSLPLFPNYLQLRARSRVPIRAWNGIRLLSLFATLALVVALFLVPQAGLFVFWQLVIPLLPMLFSSPPACGAISALWPPSIKLHACSRSRVA